MIKFIQFFLLVSCLCMLTACSLLMQPKAQVNNKYMLKCFPKQVYLQKKRPLIVLVTTPFARPIYNTTQMVYSLQPYQIAYFSKNEWAETPAEMLQPLIVQTLQATHSFNEVVTAPYMGQFDYILNTQLLALRQDFSHSTPYLIMSIRVQINKASGNVVAIKQFTVRQAFQQRSPKGGVYAANLASIEILKQIAQFSLHVMH